MTRRSLILLVLLLLMAAVPFGYWWSTRLRNIADFPAWSMTASIAHDGFVLRDRADALSYYDWHGRLRWRVAVPQRDFTGWRQPEKTDTAFLDATEGCIFSISPQGRVLAAATAKGATIHLQIWESAALIGEHRLPRPPRLAGHDAQQSVNLLACDDGRVFVWAGQNPAYPISLFNGNQSLASYAPTAMRQLNARAWQYFFFSRDGHALIAYDSDFATSIYRMQWSRQYLRLHLIGTTPTPGDLYGDTMIVTADGARYQGSERLNPGNGWLLATPPREGWHTVQLRPRSSGEYAGQLSVYHPLDNARWLLPPEHAIGGATTPDGQFAVVMHDATREGATLTVYQRPGRYRARGFLAGNRLDTTRFYAEQIAISPDGHSVLISPNADGEQFYLYRW